MDKDKNKHKPLHELEFSSFVRAPVEKVFAFQTSPEGFERNFPHPVAWPGGRPPTWKHGDKFHFRYKMLGKWRDWKGEIIDWQHHHSFTDVMYEGMLKRFEHTHQFEVKDGGTLYRDRIRFTYGMGTLIDRLIVAPMLKRLFHKRHAMMKDALER
jgi:ligand-binding SRPBCC domain-containing protein